MTETIERIDPIARAAMLNVVNLITDPDLHKMVDIGTAAECRERLAAVLQRQEEKKNAHLDYLRIDRADPDRSYMQHASAVSSAKRAFDIAVLRYLIDPEDEELTRRPTQAALTCVTNAHDWLISARRDDQANARHLRALRGER